MSRARPKRAVRILRDRGLIETRWGKGSFVARPAEPSGEGESQAD
ncbi:hypothetical protein [Streptomyces sp. 4F14]